MIQLLYRLFKNNEKILLFDCSCFEIRKANEVAHFYSEIVAGSWAWRHFYCLRLLSQINQEVLFYR